jgi:cell division protein FtsB
MPESLDLLAKIKEADPDIQEYIAQLKAINAKQHRRMIQLEAENVSLENRIEAIKEGNADPELDKMSIEEAISRLASMAEQFGYVLVKKES